MSEILIGLATGFSFGVATTVTGLLKNKTKPEWEGIDYWKAAPTIIISGLAGAYMGASGLALSEPILTATVTGLTAVGVNEWISNGIKAIKNWLSKR